MTTEQIKALRQRAGMTQEEFAAELGTTARTVSRWENGESPSRLALRALLQFERELGAPPPAE